MIVITGLGPGDIARIPGPVLGLLLDPASRLIVRTRHHPAAEQIAELRPVEFCDDLYDDEGSFERVYTAIADRVIDASSDGTVVYAVPGGPSLGEFAVRQIIERGNDVHVVPAETFVDAILAAVGYDPLDRGLQILNGHELPDPLIIDKPTIVAHLDRSEILADVAANLARVLPENSLITVFAGLGSDDEIVREVEIEHVDPSLAGFRTSLWIDTDPGGLVGVIRTMDRLRRECPWDGEQTHSTLTKNLIEEAYELIEAVDAVEVEPTDMVAYARVEEEVGDVLLQTLFHAVIAREAGAFDINDAAEVLRQKLVRRHPHVFGDVEVADAAEVKENWDRIKTEEKGFPDESVMDGVPIGMPAIHRASKIQNRAEKAGLHEGTNLDRASGRQLLDSLLEGSGEDQRQALGSLLFGLIDYARLVGIDAEAALRDAVARFETGVRTRESGKPA